MVETMMQKIMFNKHLEGLNIPQIIGAIKSVGIDGADLCVRSGYPVNPENADIALPEAAKQFASHGLSIPLVTTPGDFLDPNHAGTKRVYAACEEAGVENIKLGYWHWNLDDGGYWTKVDQCRKKLEAFERLSEAHQVRTCVHNHSGSTMGLNACAVMNLVKGFNPEYIGVFADPGHLSIVGEPIDMAIDIVKDYLAVVAFKDLMRRPGDGGGQVVRMGTGFVDWEMTVRTLKGICFKGPICFHSEYGGEPVDSVIDLARIDVRYIQNFLE